VEENAADRSHTGDDFGLVQSNACTTQSRTSYWVAEETGPQRLKAPFDSAAVAASLKRYPDTEPDYFSEPGVLLQMAGAGRFSVATCEMIFIK
jgi:hypothetical protein